MKEAQWLVCGDPRRMLNYLSGQWLSIDSTAQPTPQGPVLISERKLRLLAVAWSRALWKSYPSEGARQDHHKTLSDAEAWADSGRPALDHEYRQRWYCMLPNPVEACQELLMLERGADCAFQAALLRDIRGNPFQPVPALYKVEQVALGTGSFRTGPMRGMSGQVSVGRKVPAVSWLTPTVLSLAQAAYDQRQLDGTLDPYRLCVLADALEEAECAEEVLLRHLRGEELYSAVRTGHPGLPWWIPLRGPHVRGCAALDAILGKE